MKRRTLLSAMGGAALGATGALARPDAALAATYSGYAMAYFTESPSMTAAQVFFDPGYDAIDGNFVTVGGVNYMYFKNNTNSTLLGTRSNSLNPGSFSIYTGAIGPGRGVEAPQIVSRTPPTSGTCGATPGARTGASSAGRPATSRAARGPCSTIGPTPSR
jgi:hypothetical protein